MGSLWHQGAAGPMQRLKGRRLPFRSGLWEDNKHMLSGQDRLSSAALTNESQTVSQFSVAVAK